MVEGQTFTIGKWILNCTKNLRW